MPIPIVDGHIHLFPETHAATLAWQTTDGPLFSQYSVDEYRVATESNAVSSVAQPKDTPYLLRGFVFLETDRISSLDEDTGGWDFALDEVSLIKRVALGTPVPGEGHKPEDSRLCLGIVPWAPVPLGPARLEYYMNVVQKLVQSEEVFKKIRGVRYLAQDKPSGVMLKNEFVEGLKWLGKRGLTFDVGVDARQGGLWQLKEAVEMMRRAHEGVDEEEKVVFIINHLCKPNLQVPCDSTESIKRHPDFVEWKTHVTDMAAHSRTYMKISGSFSELGLALTAKTEPDYDLILTKLEPWTDVVFETFGSHRVLFGSDWPICNIGGGGNTVAWQRWVKIVDTIAQRRGLTAEQKADVFGGVAIKAYGLHV